MQVQILEPPTHGGEGWYLADYDWDELTGIARCEYHRGIGTEREREKGIVNRPQRISDEFHARVAEEMRTPEEPILVVEAT